MLVSNIRLFPLKTEGSIKANGKVIINDMFEVSFRIMSGSKGLFVGWPGKFGEKLNEEGKKPWYPEFKVLDEGVREEINSAIMTEFENQKGSKAPSAPAAGYPTPKKPYNGKTSVPF